MRNDGFTLIEVLIVASITTLITGFLITNFSRVRIDIDQATNEFVANIRLIQTQATTSTKSSGVYRCGYGIRYINSTSYASYTTAAASAATCAQNKNYSSAAGDIELVRFNVRDSSTIKIFAAFSDIFFEPPQPKTYLNDSLVASPTKIILWIEGTDCATDTDLCRSICIYNSGRIETIEGAGNCP